MMGAKRNEIEFNKPGVYGYWTAIAEAGQDANGKRLILVRCTHGEFVVRATKLATGRTTGCPACVHTIHGLSRLPEYNVCHQAILRCTDPTHPSYPYYGGDPTKRVWVQADWHTPGNLGVGIAKMTEYVLRTIGPRPSKNHQIDRIDNTGGYVEGNLRWVWPSQNSRNRRDNRVIPWNGKTQTLIEWSEELGIPRDTLALRLNQPDRWTLDQAMSTPVRSCVRKSKPAFGQAA